MHSSLINRSLFDLDTDDRTREICVVGELDLATRDRLAADARRLQQLARGDLTVCLDRTTFIDAAGLGVLVSIALTQQARGDRFEVTCTPPALMRIFTLVGLSHLLDRTDELRCRGRHVVLIGPWPHAASGASVGATRYARSR